MHKFLGLVLVLIAGLAVPAQSAFVERHTAIDGTTGGRAVIAPVFTGTQATSGPQSFIRLFNGSSSGSSNFVVTVVGVPSGHVYGASNGILIPHLASIQYSIQELLSIVGAGALTSGDTGYAVYLQDADLKAGYQHVVYDWTTNLFENTSSCGSLINAQLSTQLGQLVLTNLHTAGGPNKIGVNFPSSIYIHNYAAVAANYTLTVYNAGSRTGTGAISATSGKQTCQIGGKSIPANGTLTIPVSSIEATAGCTLDSDEDYINVTLANGSGSPNAVVSHLVHVSQYNGNSNLSDTCAVNKVAN